MGCSFLTGHPTVGFSSPDSTAHRSYSDRHAPSLERRVTRRGMVGAVACVDVPIPMTLNKSTAQLQPPFESIIQSPTNNTNITTKTNSTKKKKTSSSSSRLASLHAGLAAYRSKAHEAWKVHEFYRLTSSNRPSNESTYSYRHQTHSKFGMVLSFLSPSIMHVYQRVCNGVIFLRMFLVACCCESEAAGSIEGIRARDERRTTKLVFILVAFGFIVWYYR